MAKMQHWIGRDAQAEVNCHPIILFLKLGAPVDMNYYTGVTLKRTAFGLGCSEPEVAEELTHYSQVCFLLMNVPELQLEAVHQIKCLFHRFHGCSTSFIKKGQFTMPQILFCHKFSYLYQSSESSGETMLSMSG